LSRPERPRLADQIRRLDRSWRPSRRSIVILTTFEQDEYVFESLQAGASGFLVKGTEPADLVRAVRAVTSGDALLSPGVTRRLIEEYASHAKEAQPAATLEQLTERERQVMALVAEGLSNEEIAQKLFASPTTAKTHVSRAMVKLRARDRAQLVVFAYESGLCVRAGSTEQPGFQNSASRRGSVASPLIVQNVVISPLYGAQRPQSGTGTVRWVARPTAMFVRWAFGSLVIEEVGS
jgi:DNA-binding NarL/FixJ family response regulator